MPSVFKNSSETDSAKSDISTTEKDIKKPDVSTSKKNAAKEEKGSSSGAIWLYIGVCAALITILSVFQNKPNAGHNEGKAVSSVNTLTRSSVPEFHAKPIEIPSENDSELIRQIQLLLKEKGYNPGPVDGVCGRRTVEAIKLFQKRTNDTPTGKVNRDLLDKLKNSNDSLTLKAITLQNSISFKIPSHWSLVDDHLRQMLNNSRNTATIPLNTADFVAEHRSSSEYAAIRVTFVEQDPPLSQGEFVKLIKNSQKKLLSDAETAWKLNEDNMWNQLKKEGITQSGKTTLFFDSIGSKKAFVISYSYVDPRLNNKITNIKIHYIPVGNKRIILTLSYLKSDSKSVADCEIVKNSIHIK